MKSLDSVQAVAPGKLILSGEHAVVYGHPALVMAVNRYVKTSVQSQVDQQISFCFPDLGMRQNLTYTTLMQSHQRIEQNYQAFLNNDFAIKDVLNEPIELVQFAVSLLLKTVDSSSVAGVRINMHTDIPVGCGMGSSAAAVLSVLVALIQYLKVNVSSELLFDLAHQAENKQHGKSSGLDLRSSLHGGCLYFKAGQIESRLLPKLPLFLINTGAPITTTGECVAAAAPCFKNTNIGMDFAAVTEALDKALQFNKLDEIIFAIRENHRLLRAIGVVPQRVQLIIAEIEKMGGAAKVSGAGAVEGDSAGALLVLVDDQDGLRKIVERYQQEVLSIECEERGVCLQS